MRFIAAILFVSSTIGFAAPKDYCFGEPKGDISKLQARMEQLVADYMAKYKDESPTIEHVKETLNDLSKSYAEILATAEPMPVESDSKEIKRVRPARLAPDTVMKDRDVRRVLDAQSEMELRVLALVVGLSGAKTRSDYHYHWMLLNGTNVHLSVAHGWNSLDAIASRMIQNPPKLGSGGDVYNSFYRLVGEETQTGLKILIVDSISWQSLRMTQTKHLIEEESLEANKASVEKNKKAVKAMVNPPGEITLRLYW